MVKELARPTRRGEVLTDVQALIEEAGYGANARGDRLSEMAGLSRVYLWQIARGDRTPSAEQRGRLVRACQALIEERRARGELRDISPPESNNPF